MIERLSGRRAFECLRREGRRGGRGPLRVVVREDPDAPSRFAFAIPRHVGNAVVRNRTKRRLRAVLTEIDREDTPLPRGGDYLVRVTAPIDEWSHQRLHTAMYEILEDAP